MESSLVQKLKNILRNKEVCREKARERERERERERDLEIVKKK